MNINYTKLQQNYRIYKIYIEKFNCLLLLW